MKAWVELYNDPPVREHFEGSVTRTESEWWSGLEARLGDPEQPLSVVLTTTNEFIGQCGYLRWSDAPTEWEIYCQFQTMHWGRGLASELCSALVATAFSSLSASLVIGIVNPANSKSIALVRKLGFSETGKKVSPGTWQDGHLVYSIRREAYNNALQWTR